MQTQAMARHASYWESEVPAPSPPGDLPARADVLVVGAGFMGRWLAYFIGKRARTLNVLVIERDQFSYGASSRNAGFLTCGQASEMLADAAEAGLDIVLETLRMRRQGIALVRQEVPDLPLDECGSTDHDPVTEATRALLPRLNEAAGDDIYSIREACLGGRTQPAVFNRADAGVHPVRLLKLLQQRSPARFAFGVQAEKVADGVARLAMPTGAREVRYGRAFVCVNAFASALDESSPVVPGRGQVIVTSPIETRTDRTLGYLNAGYDYFRFVDGRLLLGGGRHKFRATETTRELAATPQLRGYLQAQAARVLGHDNFAIEHHWAGIMGFVGGAHLGGSPRRRVDASTEHVAGFGGMGVALAPVYAQQIAHEFQ